METPANQTTFRSYLFFWSGQLVSLLGSSISQFVIIWWITLETESTLFLSIAAFLGLAPMVLLSPFTGVFVDRWNRKTLIGVADFLQAITTVGLIFLFSLGSISVLQVLVILTLKGILQAFHYPAVTATTPLMVPREKLSRMNGVNFLFNGAINLIGPVVAALLLGFLEVYQILWVDAITFTVAVIPLLVIVIPSLRKEQEESSFRREFAEGLGLIKNTKGLLPFILLSTVLNFLLTPLATLIPYFVKFDHFGDAPDLAFVIAFFQGGMVAGGVIMSVIRGFKRKMVVIMTFAYVLFSGYILFALTPTGLFWFMALSAMVFAFGIPIINVSYMTIIQTVVPVKLQGRVNSVDMALSSAAQPFGMIASGAIAAFTGISSFFLACALSGLLVLTLSWFLTDIRHVDKMEVASTPTSPNRVSTS